VIVKTQIQEKSIPSYIECVNPLE